VPHLFISYSRKDSDFVCKMGEALAAKKREAWVDWKDIPLTAEWQHEIFTNIEAADDFLFIISPESVASTNCRKEIDHAVANNKRMVPILYRPVPQETVPAALDKFQWLDFTDRDQFDSKFGALIKALDTDLTWVQAHTRLLTRAKEWEKLKDRSFLLRGKDLSEAEEWTVKSAEKEPKPTTLQLEYILASRQDASKRQRIVITTVSVAFLVVAGLAVYGFVQKNVAQRQTREAEHQRKVADDNASEAQLQKKAADTNAGEAKRQESFAREETASAQRNAREAKARELAAFAAQSMSEDQERSIILGMQAVDAPLQFELPVLPMAQDILHNAILTSEERLNVLADESGVRSVTFSPDGRYLAAGGNNGKIGLWDAATGREVLILLRHDGSVNGVAFSTDGKRIATASDDNTAGLWDAATGPLKQQAA
jgi:TIR domain/WD domain, G-beta repeat